MIRILDRMICRAFMRLFIRFILGAPILFILGDVTEKLDDYLDRGLSLPEVALGYLYQFPHFMTLSFPIAGLVATVFTIHSMTTHREIVAAKGGGISFHRLVAPLIVLGVVLTGVGLWMSSIVPTTNRLSAEVFQEREARREWRQRFVYQSENDETLTVQRLFVGSSTLEGIVMEVPEPDGTRLHVWANQGYYSNADGWIFQDGYLRRVTAEGQETTYSFERYRPRRFTVPPEGLLEEPRDADEMTYEELGRQAAAVHRSGGDPQELLVDREQKLSIPGATLVIILFGAPLATTAKRGGAAFGVGASLGSTILYMILLRIFGAIGAAGGLPPIWAAWTPNLLFLVAAVVLLSRVRT